MVNQPLAISFQLLVLVIVITSKFAAASAARDLLFVEQKMSKRIGY
jgi:hypothetical protein